LDRPDNALSFDSNNKLDDDLPGIGGLVDTEKSVMSEAVFDGAKEGARSVVACLQEADLFVHSPLSPQALEAANDNHRSWPLIPFSPDWYDTCLGDRGYGEQPLDASAQRPRDADRDVPVLRCADKAAYRRLQFLAFLGGFAKLLHIARRK
jgi:hypothetical protein